MSKVVVARRRTLPGFGLTMGYSVFYLSLVVLIPLAALLFNSTGLTWATMIEVATNPRVLASFQVSFLTAGAAALIDLVLGYSWHGCLFGMNFRAKGCLMRSLICLLPCRQR